MTPSPDATAALPARPSHRTATAAAVLVVLGLACVAPAPSRSAEPSAASGSRAVVVLEPSPGLFSALVSAVSGVPRRGTDPSPDFLLGLAPMLRERAPADLLVASPANRKCIEDRLRRARPGEVWLLGPKHHAAFECGRTCREFTGSPSEILRQLRSLYYRDARTAVVADRANAGQALLGCILATARRAPLYLVDRKQPAESQMDAGIVRFRHIECIGERSDWKTVRLPGSGNRVYLSDSERVLADYTRALGLEQAGHVVIVRMPEATPDPGAVPFWALAVPYALKHRAAILLAKGNSNLEEHIAGTLAEKFPKARYVTIFGSDATLPLVQVPDPAGPSANGHRRVRSGNPADPQEHVEDYEDASSVNYHPRRVDPQAPPASEPAPAKTIEVDMLCGTRFRQPSKWRTGRITGDSLATVSLLGAESGLSAGASGGGRAWMMANVGNQLPMLECIARATEKELAARGWQFSASYGPNPSIPIERLQAADLVVYQGHTADLGQFSAFSQKLKQLPPSLFILQGCFSLRQNETLTLLQRGAAGVIGSTSNMYSASGGAFTKAFLDALTEGHDAGTSLMIARNYMLALSVMKENRGHQQSGPPLRAAMSFCLWGDPTWKLPAALIAPPSDRVQAIRKGNRLQLHVPVSWPEEVRAGKYHAASPIGGKISGVYSEEQGKDKDRQLVPQYFVVVPMEDWKGGEPPLLSSKLPGSRWVSLWDPDNRWLYLLVWGSSTSNRDRGRTFSFEMR